MSIRNLDLIWQHEKVLPYLFNELKPEIEQITAIHAIYLYGSRARVPFSQWDNKLDGKDWDILVHCRFPIVNTRIWTMDVGYYIDLKITGQKGINNFLSYKKDFVEIYPNNVLIEHEQL